MGHSKIYDLLNFIRRIVLVIHILHVDSVLGSSIRTLNFIDVVFTIHAINEGTTYDEGVTDGHLRRNFRVQNSTKDYYMAIMYDILENKRVKQGEGRILLAVLLHILYVEEGGLGLLDRRRDLSLCDRINLVY